jgi:hypothetical protein
MDVPEGVPTAIVLTITLLSRYIGLNSDQNTLETEDSNTMLSDLYEKLTRFIQMNMRDEYQEDGVYVTILLLIIIDHPLTSSNNHSRHMIETL